jgi:hypothetical protein
VLAVDPGTNHINSVYKSMVIVFLDGVSYVKYEILIGEVQGADDDLVSAGPE